MVDFSRFTSVWTTLVVSGGQPSGGVVAGRNSTSVCWNGGYVCQNSRPYSSRIQYPRRCGDCVTPHLLVVAGGFVRGVRRCDIFVI